MRLPPARGPGTHRRTGRDVRRSSIGDEFEQSASSSASAEHSGRSDRGPRRNRTRSIGRRRATVCHRSVCRRALRCWSTTRVLDIRGARPHHDCPAQYAARGVAHQVDDSAFRKRAASERLRPQVFLIVAWARKGSAVLLNQIVVSQLLCSDSRRRPV